MRRFGFTLAALGWFLYLASFRLPAVTNLKGWQAMLIAFSPPDELRGLLFAETLHFAAGLSNLVMLASPWGTFRSRHRLASVVRWAMRVATLVNAGVFAYWQEEGAFGLGYYLWVGSFAVVTVALQMVRFRGVERSNDSKSAGPA